jgi:hypothetical protein
MAVTTVFPEYTKHITGNIYLLALSIMTIGRERRYLIAYEWGIAYPQAVWGCWRRLNGLYA